MREPYTFVARPGQMISTAVHAGHQLRDGLLAHMALDDATRLREEDPFTEMLLPADATTVTVHRSRFEVDLNRAPDEAVYLRPADAWGLPVWADQLPAAELEQSRRLYAEFYSELAAHVDELARGGPFLVADVHSYNHRREGRAADAADPAENPEVNVGTGALDRRRWAAPVDTFIEALGACEVQGHRLDVRENVRFRGGHMSRWLVDRHPRTACVLSLEFKKVFMDEWTGDCDRDHLGQLRDALATALGTTVAAVRAVR